MTAFPSHTPTPRRIACAHCGTIFDCALSTECWCAAEPVRLPLPSDAAEDCLCPACLRKAAAATRTAR